MEDLVRQFFDNMKIWIRKIIPQETKNCLRTILGSIVGVSDDGTRVNVRLVGSNPNGSEDLIDVKISGDFKLNDVVIVAYTDNNLTNAFILFNLNSTGNQL